jgi:hypothetical protein
VEAPGASAKLKLCATRQSARGEIAMKILSASELGDMMWRRHRNPASGWTRVLLYPILLLALWYHSWILIAIVIVASITNPFWFPPPRQGDNYMTLIVDGERIWLARKNRLERFLFLALPGAQMVLLVWAAWTNHFAWTLYFAAWVLAQKTAFVLWTAEIARRTEYDRVQGPLVRAHS